MIYEDDLTNILCKFISIINKFPIQSKNNNSNEFGLLMEKMLGLSNNSLPIADYNSFEIKCMKQESKYALKLFSLNISYIDSNDNNYLIKNFYTLKGNKMSFNHSFFATKYTKIGKNNYGKLLIDFNSKKIILKIYDSNYKCIHDTSYWDVNELYKRINSKLTKIVFIEYYTKFRDKKKYYYLNSIDFLQLKSVDTFIELLKSGKIFINTSITSTNNKNIDIIKNHGFGFMIDYSNINCLYDSIKKINI